MSALSELYTALRNKKKVWKLKYDVSNPVRCVTFSMYKIVFEGRSGRRTKDAEIQYRVTTCNNFPWYKHAVYLVVMRRVGQKREIMFTISDIEEFVKYVS